MKLTELNFPDYDFKIRKGQERNEIFDPIRKYWVALTPEEWVRQNTIMYLVQELDYPQGLIAVEKGLKLHSMQKRADIIVYSAHAEPVMLIECKAPEVKISQKTFEQVAMYNLEFNVGLLMVTNGLTHFCCKIDFQSRSWSFLSEIPAFNTI